MKERGVETLLIAGIFSNKQVYKRNVFCEEIRGSEEQVNKNGKELNQCGVLQNKEEKNNEMSSINEINAHCNCKEAKRGTKSGQRKQRRCIV